MPRLRSLLALFGLAGTVVAATPTTQPANPQAAAANALLQRLDSAKSDQQARDAISQFAQALPDDWRARERLTQLLNADMDESARDSATAIARDVAFTPLMEAPRPEGWPEFTPVGEVQVKQYPAYRMAYVDRGDVVRGGEFWSLFMHIQRKGIPMTAPVEMEMSQDKTPAMQRMAFLYQNTNVGELDKSSKIKVVDVAPMKAVSVGVRGEPRGESMDEARQLIDAWLTAHPDYDRAGELRVLGYNSPQVKRDRRYFEIQVPVKERQQ